MRTRVFSAPSHQTVQLIVKILSSSFNKPKSKESDTNRAIQLQIAVSSSLKTILFPETQVSSFQTTARAIKRLEIAKNLTSNSMTYRDEGSQLVRRMNQDEVSLRHIIEQVVYKRRKARLRNDKSRPDLAPWQEVARAFKHGPGLLAIKFRPIDK